MSTGMIGVLLLLSLIFFDARSAAAEDPLSGKGLLALCSTQDATPQGAQQPAPADGFGADCLAVIGDARRMMQALKEDGNCFADIPAGATEDDLARTAVGYFKSHPALLPKAASFALFSALAAAYPCAK